MRETKKPAMAVFRLSEQLSRAVDLHAARVGITRTELFTRAVSNYLLNPGAQREFDQIASNEALNLIANSALFAEQCLAGEIDEKEAERLRTLTAKAIDAANNAAAASAASREAERLRTLTAKAIDAANTNK